MSKKRNHIISDEDRIKAGNQLDELQRDVKYDTRDFTVEHLVNKFDGVEIFRPEYQRTFIWDNTNKGKFIESVLLGLPIPFMFLGDTVSGGLEVIDGVQRLNTLTEFHDNKFALAGLKKLNLLNGFKFSDLPLSQQRRFLNRALRLIVLDGRPAPDLYQEIFNRVNKSGKPLTDSEFRRGAITGPFSNFIENLSNDEMFIEICPLPKRKVDRMERFELVLRFFAYVNKYEAFEHDVNSFLDDFLIIHQNSFDKNAFDKEFKQMCYFVKQKFPYGFAKCQNATTTPRVRFEAIAIGVALALREKPDLTISSIDSWIDSPEFKEVTTSDASNNQGRLKTRVEFVRDKLLQG